MTAPMHGTEVEVLRDKLNALPAGSAWRAGHSPERREIFTPSTHRNVLDLARSLVVGNRGVGKTFWSHALWSRTGREVAAAAYNFPQLLAIESVFGFKGTIADDTAPSTSVLTSALAKVSDPLKVWQAVLLRSYGNLDQHGLSDDLVELATWFESNTEHGERLIRDADSGRGQAGKPILVLFDALDTVADSWDEIRRRTEGLLKLALLSKGLSATYLKIFMRPDQFADTALFRFPDASKLRAERVELQWSFSDLYALMLFYIWQDTESRDALSEFTKSNLELFPVGASGSRYANARVTSVQRDLFTKIAGEWMGSSKKSGLTYSWLTQHLADARGETTPRGFLTALRAAAAHHPAPADTVIDFRGIQRGVVEASENRVDDLRQDYWWIDFIREPLAGLETPLDREILFQAWQQDGTAGRIQAARASRGLLPVFLSLRSVVNQLPKSMADNLQSDEAALLESLKLISVAELRSNGKINFPDIFRVAFKMKRRGGVPPKKMADHL